VCAVTTFPQVLSRLLAAEPGRPLVTFYDDSTGERTELSVTTWANWVAKVSSLLSEELDLGPGSRLLVDLPPHWLGTVVLGSAWACGIEVVWGEGTGRNTRGHSGGDVDAVVTGPAGLGRWATEAVRVPVVATALQPLAGPFPDGVPPGVHDLGVEVWAQPDEYAAWPGPAPDDAAVTGTTHAELWGSAAAGDRVSGGDRLLSEANPASPSGLASLIEPLVSNGSLVLVAHASAERLARIATDERVTARYPARS
jgi:uncharacterized protein (TIGR03089 family)